MRFLSLIVTRTGRYGFLLMFLCSMIGLPPFLTGFNENVLLLDMFFTGVLMSGIYALDRDPIAFRVSCFLMAVVLLLKVMRHIIGKVPALHIAELVFIILFIMQVLVMIVTHLLIEEEITADIVMGGACAFILLGFMWAYAYYLLETLQPDSLTGTKPLSVTPSDYIYFSFITLTSTGYGDILPVSAKARALTMLEAITGQLYLAIMVSRLVSLHISGSQRK